MLTTQAKLIEALDRVEEFLVKNSTVVARAITSLAHQNFGSGCFR